MLEQLEQILKQRGLVQTEWAEDTRDRGDKRAEAKRYFEGEHKVELSAEMLDMLRTTNGFQNNYCELIVTAMSDRLSVRGVGSNEPIATEWANELLKANRFDSLQIDVHEAAVCDGDTYILETYNEEKQQVEFSFEPAWDGVEGMIAVYDRRGREIDAAIKVWQETTKTRVNVYYPDEVVKYEIPVEPTDDSEPVGNLTEIDRVPWAVGRVPVVHFKNKARRANRKRFGMSQIEQVISLQDALNRTVVSMVMTGELSAFQIRVAKGFTPPTELQPGSWVIIGAEGLTSDDVVDAYTLEAAALMPFIQQANFLIDQMGTITNTPLPSLSGGDNASGESLKERKNGMINQVQRAQVRFGDAWEDMLDLAVAIHNTYNAGERVPLVTWDIRWKEAETRDAAVMRDYAALMLESGYEREFLRIMGKPLNYNEEKIDALLAEKREAEAANIALLGGNLPGFDNFALN